jgi:hypothetical protein
MSQAPPPPQRVLPVTPQPAPASQRDVPVWIFIVVIVLCLAGGGAFMWWFFAGKPATVATVKLRDDAAGAAAAQPTPGNAAPAGTPERRPDRPRRNPRQNNREFPPLPQAEMPKGTRITGKWDNAPLARVVRELPEVGKARVALASGTDDELKVTLDVSDQPLWEVLRQIAVQTRVAPSTESGERGQITLRAQSGSKALPTAVQGPYMVSLQRVNYSSSMALGGEQQQNHYVQLYFILAAEPGTPMYGITQQVKIEEAVDQAGNTLGPGNIHYSPEPQRLQNTWWMQGYGSIGFNDTSTRLARVRGYASVFTYDKLESFEIDDPVNARGKSMTIDGLRVRLRQFEETSSEYRARFEVDGNGNDPAVRYRFAPSDNNMKLLDANGRSFDSSGSSWGHGDPFQFSRDFQKSSGRAPAKLVLSVPSSLKELRVPFEFTDIPLPK